MFGAVRVHSAYLVQVQKFTFSFILFKGKAIARVVQACICTKVSTAKNSLLDRIVPIRSLPPSSYVSVSLKCKTISQLEKMTKNEKTENGSFHFYSP
jgi:hypothetical protein